MRAKTLSSIWMKVAKLQLPDLADVLIYIDQYTTTIGSANHNNWIEGLLPWACEPFLTRHICEVAPAVPMFVQEVLACPICRHLHSLPAFVLRAAFPRRPEFSYLCCEVHWTASLRWRSQELPDEGPKVLVLFPHTTRALPFVSTLPLLSNIPVAEPLRY